MRDVDVVNVSDAELPIVDLDDGMLLAMARSGHQEAYATLFSRYSYAAHRLARHLGQKEDSDDVVSEAFAQVLDLLGRGKGPERAFRAYLFTTVRHECARRAKARKRVVPTDDMQQIDTPVAFGDGQLDGFERSAIRAAYDSLPARWQTVLWHLDVEGRKPHELGPLLGLSANSVSALVYRARAGLREAYLQQHVKDDHPTDSRTCLEYRSKLSAFVRRTAPARDQERIHAHLESCADCMAIYLDLQEVNRDVGLICAPAAAATAVGGFSVAAVGAHLAVILKGVTAAVAPPAAAAALAGATLVGVSGQVPEPAGRPIAMGAAPSMTQSLRATAAKGARDEASGARAVSRQGAPSTLGSIREQRAMKPITRAESVSRQMSVPSPAAPVPPPQELEPLPDAAPPTPTSAPPEAQPDPSTALPDVDVLQITSIPDAISGALDALPGLGSPADDATPSSGTEVAPAP